MKIAEFDIQSNSIQKLAQVVQEKYSLISERRAGLSLTGVSPRNYHHWKEQGLVDATASDKERREWVRLNVYDFVWLKVIKTLREFGVPIPVLAQMKLKLWLSVLDIEMDDEAYKKAAYLPGLTDEELSEQYRLLAHTRLVRDSIPEEMKPATSFLGILTNSVLFEGNMINLIMAKDGEGFRFDVFSNSAKFGSGNVKQWQELPHISIPLNTILNDFFELPDNESNLIQWQFIDFRESQVLKAVREGEFKRVVVTRRDKKDKLYIEVTDTEEVRHEKARHLVRLFGLKDYREVVLIHRNDKHVIIKKKKRI